MAEYLSRYIESSVKRDLRSKMVFIGGPRQAGKTTLAKHLCQQAGCDLKSRYLSWDAAEDREKILREIFPAGPGFLILDEIHKYSRIYPFGAPKIRAVKKEAKHYHLDWTVISDLGSRFENLVACHLLKWCFFLQDTEGRDIELRYFRDVDKREVDFVILENGNPIQCVECKTSEKEPTLSLRYLKNRFPAMSATQVVLERDMDAMTKEGIRICSAHRFLKDLI